MTPSTVRPLDAVCLPYHGKPDKSPAAAGWWWTEDLDEARSELHQQGYIPQVKRSHKADLVRLTLNLGKSERMVLRQEPEHAQEVAAFCEHFGLEYRGQSLSTAVEQVMQLLLKQKRRQPSHEERVDVYRRQDGKCEHCNGELSIENEEFDHVLPSHEELIAAYRTQDGKCEHCNRELSIDNG